MWFIYKADNKDSSTDQEESSDVIKNSKAEILKLETQTVENESPPPSDKASSISQSILV